MMWLKRTCWIGVLVSTSAGCGHPAYLAQAARASAQLTRAEELDAADKAPYEYYYALEHLRQARVEALDAEYSDAMALLQVTIDYASRAIELSQRVEPAQPAVGQSSVPTPVTPSNGR